MAACTAIATAAPMTCMSGVPRPVAGVVCARGNGLPDVYDGVHKQHVGSDQTIAEIDARREPEGGAQNSPDPDNVGHEDGQGRQDFAPAANEPVHECSEAVVVVLLVLMKHVCRQAEKGGEKGLRPVAGKHWRKTEDENAGQKAAIDPVGDKPIEHSVGEQGSRL
jgi:hypothetical protein